MIRVALFFLVVLATSHASASTSGYVTGQVRFYNEQIGYTNNAGSHDNYKSTQFQTMQPLRGVRVELRNISFGNLLAYTYTDINGYYAMSWWSEPNVFSGFIRVVWADNGRLKVTPQAGGQYFTDFANQTLTTGNGSSNPQVLPNCDGGSSTVPFPVANIFDASWRMWYYALKYPGAVANNLWNKPIRYPSTACPNSCADATGVHLDGALNTWKASPWRASHELGHVAQYVAASGQNANLCVKYGYPATTGTGWNHDSPEWTCASYGEGFASFMATVSRHWYNSTLASECLGNETGQCNLDVESSAGSTCTPASEKRWPLTTQRFLWDSYDTSNDGEANALTFARLVQNHANFVPGTANRQRDEWNNGAANLNGAGQPIEDGWAGFDGSSAGDYFLNMLATYGDNLLASYTLNCIQQYD